MGARFGAYHGLARLEAFHRTPLRLAGSGYRLRRYAAPFGLTREGARSQTAPLRSLRPHLHIFIG
jgi:hypothetical protein